MAGHRKAYRNSLESLVEYYGKAGNDMKLNWAKKELAGLNGIPQYNYIIDASVAGPNLKASTSIPEANSLYQQAVQLEDKAGLMLVVKDENLLRKALDKYNELIRRYPSSDKIDDAAYRAGLIYEHLKDYSIAIVYYQRVCQWDSATTYPAAFRAAYILDTHLARRAEALELYRKFILGNNGSVQQRQFAERRIKELSVSDEQEEEN